MHKIRSDLVFSPQKGLSHGGLSSSTPPQEEGAQGGISDTSVSINARTTCHDNPVFLFSSDDEEDEEQSLVGCETILKKNLVASSSIDETRSFCARKEIKSNCCSSCKHYKESSNDHSSQKQNLSTQQILSNPPTSSTLHLVTTHPPYFSPTSRCRDNENFEFILDSGIYGVCDWLLEHEDNAVERTNKYCVRGDVKYNCCASCINVESTPQTTAPSSQPTTPQPINTQSTAMMPNGLTPSPTCTTNDLTFTFQLQNGSTTNCDWLLKHKDDIVDDKRTNKYCVREDVKVNCCASCINVEGAPPTKAPSRQPTSQPTQPTTNIPSEAPTPTCMDSSIFTFDLESGIIVGCDWLLKHKDDIVDDKRTNRYCVRGDVKVNCCVSCINVESAPPTKAPSRQPTSQPTQSPTRPPTSQPSPQPTQSPTRQPTSQPSPQPTHSPTTQPTSQPSPQPTQSPTRPPTSQPSPQPTQSPTRQPTSQLSPQPTQSPTSQPTPQPNQSPTSQPTSPPSPQPTQSPTRQPTSHLPQPTQSPTSQPTSQLSPQPTQSPTSQPTSPPSPQPIQSPTRQPSSQFTSQPTQSPTRQPTSQPTPQPTQSPTRQPASQPTSQPTQSPTRQPASQPTQRPTQSPTRQPSSQPSPQPIQSPTRQPSSQPTPQPIQSPIITVEPVNSPTNRPSPIPTMQPVSNPDFPISSVPTESIDLIAVEGDRRYFPARVIRPPANPPFQTIPDCSNDNGSPGCITLPTTIKLTPPPWAGLIHSKPPTCARGENGTDSSCDLGIPMSKKAASETILPSNEYNIFRDIDISLAGGDQMDVTAIATGDINDDGYIDLIIGSSDNYNQVLINDGDGNFSQQVLLSNGTVFQTTALAVADIDGDGFLDIVVANDKQDNELIFNVDGKTFQKSVLLKGGSSSISTTSVALGDVNNDGWIDIITGNDLGVNQLWLNEGEGIFSDPLNLPGGDSSTRSIALADIDNDGWVDIVVGNYGQENIILLNNGAGYFIDDAKPLPGGSKLTRAVALGDINCDARVDIVIANDNKESNDILLNIAGGGLFQLAPSLLGQNVSSTAITLGDVDGDGLVDLIFGNDRKSLNQVFTNVGGNGTFLEPILLRGSDLSTQTIAMADFANDQAADIVVGNAFQHVKIMTNDPGHGEYTDAIPLPGEEEHKTQAIVMSDLDLDGAVDLVVANGNNANQVLMNRGDGTFQDPEPLPDIDVSTRTSFGISTAQKAADTQSTSVAAADINNDGFPDLVFGNEGQNNQMLMYDATNGTYNSVTNLPGGNFFTTSVALADLNNDAWVDIVVGNKGEENLILFNNKQGDFDEVSPLKSGERHDTVAIELADLNEDKLIDIIVANKNDGIQVFVNNGDGTFEGTDLSTGSYVIKNVSSVAAVDVDDDKHIDIIVGVKGQSNLVLFGNGDSTFGELILVPRTEDTKTTSIATGDLDGDGTCDIVFGNEGASNQVLYNNGSRDFQKPKVEILKSQDQLGEPSYKRNPTFDVKIGDVDNDGTLDILVANGEGRRNEIHPFSACNRGAKTHQASWCYRCPIFMGRVPIPGSGIEHSICKECLPDHEQQNGFGEQCSERSCRARQRQFGENFCTPCKDGTFFNDNLERKEYDKSTWYDERCVPCAEGDYATEDLVAVNKCFKCPFTLTSNAGSASCPFCDKGFYLNDPSLNISSIFANATEHCLTCPSNANCSKNTTIQTFKVNAQFWRLSNASSQLYHCDNKVCVGSTLDDDEGSASYCEEGHTGPLCQVCTDERKYFNDMKGECEQCPRLFRIIVNISIIVMVIISLVLLHKYAASRIHNYTTVVSSLSFQAKLKIFVSFFQVVSSLESVYGAKIDRGLKAELNFFAIFSLDVFSIIAIPRSCIGTMWQQLLVSTLWPFAIILLGVIGMWLSRLGPCMKLSGQSSATSTLKTKALYFCIAVAYIVLPVVSLSIFDAIKCRAFKKSDELDLFESYLLADMSIQCSIESDGEYPNLLVLFWASFVLWPIIIPLLFLVILISIRKVVRASRPSPFAKGCRFLWDDYDPPMMFWDVIDTWRKTFLTGFMLLIDPAEGSNKVLRLTIATIVSSMYLGILAISRPYKRDDDFYLSFVSNFALVLLFVVGIILQLCNNEDGSCSRFVGFSFNFYRASTLALVLVIGMFIVTIVFLTIIALNKVNEPTVRLVSTGYPPQLEMPENCNFHIFMSHVWSSGQSKTHSIVRKLKLMMPRLKIWLDIEQLYDINSLEDSIAESVVMVIFYSEGYFRSKNCRREICAAMEMGKPVIILYDDEGLTIEALKYECMIYFTEEPGHFSVLEYLLQDDPIFWINEGAFNAAVLKRIYARLLQYMPYYQDERRDMLEAGVNVPGEIIDFKLSLPQPMTLIVCEANEGAFDVAEEVHFELNDQIQIHLISNKDALLTAVESPVNDDIIYDLSGGTEAVIEHFNDDNDPMEEEVSHIVDKERSALLLYLNQDAFFDEDDTVQDIIKTAMDMEIEVILVHEKDYSRGGCPFNQYFKQTPQELIDPPYELFNRRLAISLYSIEEYRCVSLYKIVKRLGGVSFDKEAEAWWRRPFSARGRSR